ncbi:hypothetical protein Prudu_213S000100 [Prunus dulcis]|uniref:Uncharacterized protein n=1 Tax=Prunus dulcis TaxID=3755 RepID=A0A5H2XUW1_PRUDU|nr:hypothetical protein Prudu_213S000100 [Prunus dulcis]
MEAGFDEVDWLWIPRHLNHGAHVAAGIDLRTVELQKLSWGGEHVAGLVFQLAAHPPFPASDKGWGKELGQNKDPFYITKDKWCISAPGAL